MLDTGAIEVTVDAGATRVSAARPVPVDALLKGRPADEAAALLPRIFNLCPTTQSVAARLALGLDLDDGQADRLRAEILREHARKFALDWPLALGLPASPGAMAQDDPAAALLGSRPFAATLDELLARLAAPDTPVLRVLAGLTALFGPGQGAAPDLPPVDTRPDPFAPEPVENTVALRWAAHPLVAGIEGAFGRGPLWRATARALELATGQTPAAQVLPDGTACVPAARGLYFCRARCDARGRVAAFARATPTDHMMAEGGSLPAALSTTPPAAVPALMAVMDPCMPVRLNRGAADA